jgi:hypothetical protein
VIVYPTLLEEEPFPQILKVMKQVNKETEVKAMEALIQTKEASLKRMRDEIADLKKQVKRLRKE